MYRQLFMPIVLLPTLLFSVSSCAKEPEKDRQTQLLHLLQHDCGSCHGMTLKGGLGPSLLPDALKSKADQLLITTISEGHKNTAMPPWKGILNEDEIVWMVSRLREGIKQWP